MAVRNRLIIVYLSNLAGIPAPAIPATFPSFPVTAYPARAVLHHTAIVGGDYSAHHGGAWRISSSLDRVGDRQRFAKLCVRYSMADTPEQEFTTWRRLALIFGVWTVVALMATQTSAFAVTRTGRSFDW